MENTVLPRIDARGRRVVSVCGPISEMRHRYSVGMMGGVSARRVLSGAGIVGGMQRVSEAAKPKVEKAKPIDTSKKVENPEVKVVEKAEEKPVGVTETEEHLTEYLEVAAEAKEKADAAELPKETAAAETEVAVVRKKRRRRKNRGVEGQAEML